ncbi:hypothetical protein ACAW63_02645 [Pseudomonas sp. QE6]|uniref:hypothetical protein n=1 Tax=Pseudomonas sp. QE6 TaxID=3242491 RepID=UPI003528CB0B
MSILNAFITPDLGLVGFDTEGAMPDGSFVDGCKLIALPHINAVIGFRGLDFVQATASPNLVSFKGTLEALADDLPRFLMDVINHCRVHHQSPDEHLGANLVLVGYSPAKGEVVGYSVSREVGADTAQSGLIVGQYIAPFWCREDLPTGIRADRQGMITLAQHQSRLSRDRMPEFAAGGRFFIAEIRRNSIRIEQAFEFPQREPGSSGKS